MVRNLSSAVNSTEELRKTNRHSVFIEIYRHQPISKQELSERLRLSIPTVTQNLNELEDVGLIRKNGVFDSTGGRKANAYEVVADAKIALGLFLQKDRFHIVAVSLFGEVLHAQTVEEPFENDAGYYFRLGEAVRNFIGQNRLDRDRILGVNAALEAIVSPDRKTVTYSEVYNCNGLTAEELGQNIPFPCDLFHDGHATAEAELWVRKEIQHAVMIILNRYLGGALIIDGKIREGKDFGCVVEHLSLSTEGPTCYCGKRGCFESFCSAYALEREAGEPLNLFFRLLRDGDRARGVIWDHYLQHLARGINNIRMIIDCEFIIGGHLLQYMTEKDFERLRELTNKECPFHLGNVIINPSCFDSESAAQGAALPLMEAFLKSV